VKNLFSRKNFRRVRRTSNETGKHLLDAPRTLRYLCAVAGKARQAVQIRQLMDKEIAVVEGQA
jgi:hypothetical protein